MIAPARKLTEMPVMALIEKSRSRMSNSGASAEIYLMAGSPESITTPRTSIVQLLARPSGLFADGVGARDDSIVGAANPVQVRVVVERTAQMHHQPGDRVRNIVVRASSHVR
jgi:hypothetical protein